MTVYTSLKQHQRQPRVATLAKISLAKQDLMLRRCVAEQALNGQLMYPCAECNRELKKHCDRSLTAPVEGLQSP